jgi:hypothetical protein
MRQLDLHAADGELGVIDDLYFDCHKWLIRYIAIGHEGEPRGTVHLVPALAMNGINKRHHEIYVELTRDEVIHSPVLEPRARISRAQERRIFDYYGWPAYWEHENAAQSAPNNIGDSVEWLAQSDAARTKSADSDLCRLSEFEGYKLEAGDGTVGYIDDILIDTRRWTVRYFEVGARQFADGHGKILDARAVKYVDSGGNRLVTDVKAASMADAG